MIISDGAETYSVFTYNCDQLNWIGEPGAYASVGLSVLGNAPDFRNFENYVLSRRPEVGMIACTNERLNRPWTNVIYRIGVAVTDAQMVRSRCLSRFESDVNLFPFDFNAIFLTPDCPCSLFQAFSDSRYFSASSFPNPALDQSCFLTKFAASFQGQFLSRRCCYSTRYYDLLCTLQKVTSWVLCWAYQ